MTTDSTEGVDSSLYDSGEPETPPEDKPKAESVDEQEAMDPTSLVDLKVLTGKHGAPKEGDEIVVKVVKIHGDQAEIEYAPEKASETKEDDSGEDPELASMNSKY